MMGRAARRLPLLSLEGSVLLALFVFVTPTSCFIVSPSPAHLARQRAMPLFSSTKMRTRSQGLSHYAMAQPDAPHDVSKEGDALPPLPEPPSTGWKLPWSSPRSAPSLSLPPSSPHLPLTCRTFRCHSRPTFTCIILPGA